MAVAQRPWHSLEYGRARWCGTGASGPGPADGVAVQALHRRYHPHGLCCRHRADDWPAGGGGGGRRGPAAVLLLHVDHGQHPPDQQHSPAYLQPPVPYPALRHGTGAPFGRRGVEAGERHRRRGRSLDVAVPATADYRQPVAGRIPADALHGCPLGVDPAGAHAHGRPLWQAAGAPAAHHDPRHSPAGEPHPDADAGRNGA